MSDVETKTAISPRYNPAEVEDKWYQYWLDNNLFDSDPDGREPFTIVIPPPNVTGVLHMGHMLNNTIQDILVRRARMMGKNACWVPGTDHASIATEAKVVAKLKAEGIDKSAISREEFLRHAWEWKEKHGGIILQQLRKLGASCDWRRTSFTMDDKLSESVTKVFVDLHQKGLIYRGVRMVNWDPQARTAVSDEEVVYKEEHGKLYYLRYKIEGEEGYAVVATTRPETIMGDTAMCVNPNDPKNAHLKGKRVVVPLVGRPVPVIEDEYVDIEFGTGCLKVTPSHDVNDYMLGQKHNLPSIDIFEDDGTISERAGLYAGLDRFEVRRRIEKDLAEAGLLEKVEPYTNKVGYSERTNVVIEPKLSMQWFLKIDRLARAALEPVLDGRVRLHPAKYKNVYRHWLENAKDWCVSRQLWWGHRIPAWYLPQGGYVVAADAAQALELARAQAGDPNLQAADLRQDDDCLDTWFSSWLWPISLFDGINRPGNPEISYYYPTQDLVTGPDIIFFWVARMIMAGYEYTGRQPFHNVYFTGVVRDKLGRKMSKSLGNSPDPLEMMRAYGADGVRVGMLLCSPAGNDLLFDESLPEQGRNFGNKIWNALRLVKSWREDPGAAQPEASAQAAEWFAGRLSQAAAQIDAHFAQYRINDALLETYRLFWDDFASWYLEAAKPAFGAGVDSRTLAQATRFFDALLRLLHPFMPFITEEAWQRLSPRAAGESIMVAPMPRPEAFDEASLSLFGVHCEMVSAVRNLRASKNIPFRQELEACVKPGQGTPFEPRYAAVVRKLANLRSFGLADAKPQGAAVQMVGAHELYIPLGGLVDTGEEIRKLESELEYTRGFLRQVAGKLGNAKFVASAPAAVVDAERKKEADAQARIAAIEAQLASLRG